MKSRPGTGGAQDYRESVRRDNRVAGAGIRLD